MRRVWWLEGEQLTAVYAVKTNCYLRIRAVGLLSDVPVGNFVEQFGARFNPY